MPPELRHRQLTRVAAVEFVDFSEDDAVDVEVEAHTCGEGGNTLHVA